MIKQINHLQINNLRLKQFTKKANLDLLKLLNIYLIEPINKCMEN